MREDRNAQWRVFHLHMKRFGEWAHVWLCLYYAGCHLIRVFLTQAVEGVHVRSCTSWFPEINVLVGLKVGNSFSNRLVYGWIGVGLQTLFSVMLVEGLGPMSTCLPLLHPFANVSLWAVFHSAIYYLLLKSDISKWWRRVDSFLKT